MKAPHNSLYDPSPYAVSNHELWSSFFITGYGSVLRAWNIYNGDVPSGKAVNI